MAFGQPSAFGSFGTSGFSGTGSGAAKQPTNPFGTGTGFGASGGTSPWGAAPTSSGGGSAGGGASPWGAFSPTSGGQGQQGGGQQRSGGGFEYAYNPADYPLTGPPPTLDSGRWHHDGSKWVDMWQMVSGPVGGPRPTPTVPTAPTPPAAPAPTSPTGPGTGTGTGPGMGAGYDWANLLGNFRGGGGGGGTSIGLSGSNMSITSSNDAIWNANLQRVKDNGHYQTFLDTLLTSPDAYLGRSESPGNDVGYMRDLAASELNIDGRIANDFDTYRRIADAWRIRKQQDADKAIADEAAKRARETASTTGITLPFPA